MPRLPLPRNGADLPGLREDTARQLNILLRTVQLAVAGTRPPAARNELSSIASLLSQLLRVLALLHSAHVANTAATAANTVATAQNSAATAAGAAAGGGGSGGGFLGKLLGGFSRAFGIASLALSVFSLFRRPREPRVELTPFQSPASLSLEVANTDNILRGLPRLDFSAEGTPRPIESPPPPPAAEATPAPGVQVTVNVSAMDSRSFMDHAPDLARAVREAMLHMHPINQLVRESF